MAPTTSTNAFNRAALAAASCALAGLTLVGCSSGSGSKASANTTTTQPKIGIGTCFDNANPDYPEVVACTDKTAAIRIARYKILDCPAGMSILHVLAGGSGTWCAEPIKH